MITLNSKAVVPLNLRIGRTCGLSRLIRALILVCLFGLAGCSSEHNPYTILTRHYEATGGVKRWKAVESTFEAYRLVYPGTDVSYYCESWKLSTGQDYTRIQSDEEEVISGYNGRISWNLDKDGLVTDSSVDVASRNRAAVAMWNLEQLDPASDVFRLSYNGVTEEDENPCFLVQMDWGEPKKTYIYYIDTSSYLCIRSDFHTQKGDLIGKYADFARIDGFVKAKTQFVADIVKNLYFELHLERWVVDSMPDPGIFDPPVDATVKQDGQLE